MEPDEDESGKKDIVEEYSKTDDDGNEIIRTNDPDELIAYFREKYAYFTQFAEIFDIPELRERFDEIFRYVPIYFQRRELSKDIQKKTEAKLDKLILRYFVKPIPLKLDEERTIFIVLNSYFEYKFEYSLNKGNRDELYVHWDNAPVSRRECIKDLKTFYAELFKKNEYQLLKNIQAEIILIEKETGLIINLKSTSDIFKFIKEYHKSTLDIKDRPQELLEKNEYINLLFSNMEDQLDQPTRGRPRFYTKKRLDRIENWIKSEYAKGEKSLQTIWEDVYAVFAPQIPASSFNSEDGYDDFVPQIPASSFKSSILARRKGLTQKELQKWLSETKQNKVKD